jgi:O-acetyl-ADP-ribose deacetylase (regulator of RNase III)
MKLILCDVDASVVAAWRAQFARHPEVQVFEKSILDVEIDAVVNPGNSFGFMDGGLALKLCEKFGFEIQEVVRKAVRERYGKEMLVGQADVFPTGKTPAFLIHAPTMRTPQPIGDTVNAYLAARAAFNAAKAYNSNAAKGGEPIGTVALPGLGTGTGKMNPLVSARQIRYAYEEAWDLRKFPDQNLSRLSRRDKKLKEVPGGKEEEE